MFMRQVHSGFVTGLFIFVFLNGIAGEVGAAVTKSEFEFKSNGKSYNALMYRADAIQKSKPNALVIVVPGDGIKLARFVRATRLTKQLSKHSSSQNFVIVLPQVNHHEDWTNWLTKPDTNYPAIFFRSIISEARKELGLKFNNIYLAGFSMGGVMVLSAMCELENEVTAFSVVSASLPKALRPTCNIQRSVPAIIISSRDDLVMPWEGGVINKQYEENVSIDVLSVTGTVDLWSAANKCNNRPLLKPVANLDPTDRTTVTRLIYDYGCQQNATIELYAIKGGGHSWPGSAVRLKSFEGKVSQDISATDILWELFVNRQASQ